MRAPKWIVVALLLSSASLPAFAQGTQQRMYPSGGYNTGYPEPIGNSGAPVPTGHYNYSPGPPAQSRIVVIPQRRLRIK